jgi:hypothetical protein
MQDKDWLRRHVRELTAQQERFAMSSNRLHV